MTYDDNRNRYGTHCGSDNSMLWIGGLLGVLLIIGGVMWAMNGDDNRITATTPTTPTTTTIGQGPSSTPANTGRSPAKQNPPAGPATAPNP